MMKRGIDLLGSSFLLIILSPALLVTAVLVRLQLGSPILFRQLRPGLRGKPFQILKFRSMTDTRDVDGNLLPDDQRLTRLGKFLRSMSLDEVPELVNVVKGEMSLVGPRPLLMQYLARYTREQMRRHELRPGITGWAQVNGRNTLSWDEKFKLDVWYVENRSAWLDLKVLIMTAWMMLKRDGISQDGYATMPEFMGSAERGTDGAGLETRDQRSPSKRAG
jgi:lipopolysaccharide/colanic/teichoic acid biosynthesis glycosyltransferase